MTSGTIQDTTPVGAALCAARVTMAELITAIRDGGLDHYDPAGLQAVDADLLSVCRDRGVADQECQRSMAKVLERRFLVSPYEASRRVKAATAAGPRTSMTGLPLPRLRPGIADAMSTGTITSEQSAMVCKALDELEQTVTDPVEVGKIETQLVELCQQFAPRELKTVCARILEIHDPDGAEPDEQRNWDRRFRRMRTTSTGSVTGEFRFTPETAVKARAILEALANPRVDTACGEGAVDLRNHEQRMHDAFDEICSRLLRAGGLPHSGGTPATVIVTVQLEDLIAQLEHVLGPDWQSLISDAATQTARDTTAGDHDHPTRTEPSDPPTCTEPVEVPDQLSPPADPARLSTSSGNGRPRLRRRRRSRYGTAGDGTRLSIAEIMRLAGEAEIYPVVITKHGVLLDLGRTRRIANKHQTIALIARDGGCSFPGFDRAPQWCERHHVDPWLHNGKTELRNLTLLCHYHHRHFLDRGWQVRINDDGLPEWISPHYIDRDQKPMINNRILARIIQHPLTT